MHEKPIHPNTLYSRIEDLRGDLHAPLREILALDKQYALHDIFPEAAADSLPPEVRAVKEVRQLLEQANSGIHRVLELLDAARSAAVELTDPTQTP
ncbi:hypothetical protein ACFVVM_32465 [Nocardia sp. NPDC058176]|uniref:hypothetical protein n=1 Tax=Nocardia sp. NPDC058176 TaxID=3346368 RepID=UPI0036D9CCA3